ncbi:MAG: PKD domain-containing protein [Cryomorphaceae bacterium]|nr:MAG: PKD domain-containing protein [Cryomorphaceae bacterium]
MKLNKTSGLILLLTLFSQPFFAQVFTENNLTVEEYVQTVLLGEGVEVSNITYNGAPANTVQTRVGLVNGENSNFYFDEAFMMATRNISIASCEPEDFPGGGPGVDADLSQIAGQNLQDVTVVEFDFVPQGDTVSFNFVFASREYSGFVCSSFNDVFGFFLSGPGITGPYSNNAMNIALLPDGVTPVTINNVNNGANDFFGGGTGQPCSFGGNNCPCNPQYFTDNGSGNGTDLHSDMCFGGYTVPLQAIALVECGLTYHIKLAIANAVDGALQSAVFLEAGSFASSSLITVDLQIDAGLNDSTLVEGCGGATLTFERQLDNVEQVIYLTMEGDATNGVDYTLIPDSIVFPVGVTEVSIFVEAFHDGIVEGLESVIIIIENENVCGGENLQSIFTFYIDEYDPLEVISHDGFIDCGEPIDLIPEATGGSPPLNYLWSTGETSETITVAPIENTTYTLTVTDSCGLYEETVEFFVEVPQFDELAVDIGPDWTLTCITPVLIEPDITGGSGDFVFEWFQNGQFVNNNLVWDVLPEGEGMLVFRVTDHCGNTDSDTLYYETPPVEITVDLGDDYFASCIDVTSITGLYSGGVGEYTFQWYVNGQPYSTLPAIGFQSLITSEIIFEVTDECGNVGTDVVIVFIPNIPLELSISPDTTICLGDRAHLLAEATGGEGGFTYQWSNGQTSPGIQVIPNDTTTYTVVATDICGITIGGSTTVNTTSVHAEFTIDFVGTNGASFQNLSTPDVNYLWHFGDGNKSREFEPIHEYYFDGNYYISLYVTDSLGCSDLFAMEYNPPMFLYIPNAFTPNNDGINELFKAQGVGIKSFEMSIWNRQGERLFHTTNINEGWNGSMNGSSYFVPDGVYVVKYKAETFDGQKVENTGHVTVVR